MTNIELPLSNFLPKVDACRLISLNLVDSGFDIILVFHVVRWTALFEDGVFKFDDGALEAQFLCSVKTSTSIPTSALSGTTLTFLPHLVLVTHGDILDIEEFLKRIL